MTFQAAFRWLTLCLITAYITLPAPADQAWPPAPPLPKVEQVETGQLPPSVDAELVRPNLWRVTFRFKPTVKADTVSLAGTFNGWNRGANPMTGPVGADYHYETSVELSPGKHLYKFVVNGNQWFPDPKNPDGEDDGHQGTNSVLRLGELAQQKTSPAKRGDGRIETFGLEHRPDLPLYFQPLSETSALFRYRTFAHDVERVWVAVKGETLTRMHPIREDQLFELWEAEVPLPHARKANSAVCQADYTFILNDGSQERAADPNTYVASFTPADIFETPDWAKNAIWYQIMPERFRNGDPANDPKPTTPWTHEWFSPTPWEAENDQTFYKWEVFGRYYGGDIAGLIEKLPYLKDLGVNAIYFNPVFEADSSHKYNATTYVHIDDNFGTKGDYARAASVEDPADPGTWTWTPSDKLFLEFLDKAHQAGFKVIIDGVFNHVGTKHPIFQDVKNKGQQSPYADWFQVTSWDPFEYEGWAGFDALPVFRKSPDGLASDAAKQHIFDVTRRWMDPNGDGDPSDGVDGWRLDVPNEINPPFWAEWRKLVKSINPDAYITAEIWDRADEFLSGDHYDAVMNYEFAEAVVAWIINNRQKITVSEFDRRLRDLRMAYPLAATLVLQNLMNSHDTDRLVSMIINPDRAYDHANRIQDNGPNYDNCKPPAEAYKIARLIALIQMTYIGAPMVYYGDEAGMWGADDPTCRKPMLWKDLEPYDEPHENYVMTQHLDYYRRAIHLRRQHPALRTGSFQSLLTHDEADVWAFLRADDNEQLVVAINASSKDRGVIITLPPDSPRAWRGVFGSDETFDAPNERITLRIPGHSGIVLQAGAANAAQPAPGIRREH